MWLPSEENHEVTGFVRAVGGVKHWGGEGHCRGVGHCRGEGKGRAGRGAQLVHNKHMLHCVRQEHFIYTQTIRWAGYWEGEGQRRAGQ